MSILIVTSNKNLERIMRTVAFDLNRVMHCAGAVSAIEHAKHQIPALIVVEDTAVTPSQLRSLRRHRVHLVYISAFEVLEPSRTIDIAARLIREKITPLLQQQPDPT